jgi:hypothetical protein
MQHKAAVVLDRAAKQDGFVDDGFVDVIGQFQVDPLEQRFHGHVGGLVDDHAEHAFVVVLAYVDDRAAEHRVIHRRHGDQEMIRQVQSGRSRAGVAHVLAGFLGKAKHGQRLANLAILHTLTLRTLSLAPRSRP